MSGADAKASRLVRIVRSAEERDIPACMDVQESEGPPYFSEADFVSMVRNSECIFLVVELEERVVGFIAGFVLPTKRSEASIHSTMVHRRFRGRGLGRTLVESFATAAFGSRGVEIITAGVEPGPDIFYQKCLFQKDLRWTSIVLQKERFIKSVPKEREEKTPSAEGKRRRE